MEGLRWILLLLGAVLVAVVYWSGRREADEPRESLYERARRAVEREEAGAQPGSDERERDPDLTIGPDDDPAPPGDGQAPGAAAESDDVEAAEPGPDAGAAEGADAEPADAVADAEPPAAAPDREPEPVPTGARSAGPDGGERERGGDEPMVVLFLVAAEGERLVGSQLAEAFARHGLEHGEHQIFHARDGEGGTVFSVANAVEPGTFDPATMDTLSTPGLALVLRLPGPQSAETAFDRMLTTARALADELGGRVLDGSRSTLTRQTEQHLREELRAFDLRRSRGQP